MTVKLHESNCRMIKSWKKIHKKRFKKQNTSKTKWKIKFQNNQKHKKNKENQFLMSSIMMDEISKNS
jgi:hypothetical protein